MLHSQKWLLLASCCAGLLQACSGPPLPDPTMPGAAVRRMADERLTAVVVTSRKSLAAWTGNHFSISKAPGEADGGSGTPVSPDGYFVTADHVLAQSPGHQVFVVYRNGGNNRTARARIVWRSAKGDLAIVHAPFPTPYYYRWTSPGSWLPAGTPIVHGGISTGAVTPVGRLSTDISPESPMTGARAFKIDVPLRPGDSGGPVLNGHGQLIGINSAVEFLVPMETAFFIDSEGNRPNVRTLEAIIERDRRTPRHGAVY